MNRRTIREYLRTVADRQPVPLWALAAFCIGGAACLIAAYLLIQDAMTDSAGNLVGQIVLIGVSLILLGMFVYAMIMADIHVRLLRRCFRLPSKKYRPWNNHHLPNHTNNWRHQ